MKIDKFIQYEMLHRVFQEQQVGFYGSLPIKVLVSCWQNTGLRHSDLLFVLIDGYNSGYLDGRSSSLGEEIIYLRPLPTLPSLSLRSLPYLTTFWLEVQPHLKRRAKLSTRPGQPGPHWEQVPEVFRQVRLRRHHLHLNPQPFLSEQSLQFLPE